MARFRRTLYLQVPPNLRMLQIAKDKVSVRSTWKPLTFVVQNPSVFAAPLLRSVVTETTYLPPGLKWRSRINLSKAHGPAVTGFKSD